ncbi:MAG: 2Fe-2S iron-sulfur cluster-binding protein [Rhizobiaceae bacterium]
MTARRIQTGGSPLRFTFDGRPLEGRAGDTVASALIAAGVRIVGRSFKYHRPRGVWGAGSEEPNALVDVTLAGRTTPNVRATTEMLADGMVVRSVNAAPTAERDRVAFVDRLQRFLPAGFYYKTFMWPNWHSFEPRIRAMAGLGRVDPQAVIPADNPTFNAQIDLLVVGAGPAGLAAAKAGAASDQSVMLVDDQPAPGASLLHRDAIIDGMAGDAWAADAVGTLRASGHTVLADATAFGVYDHNVVLVWQRRAGAPDALWQVRAKRIVVAAGAIERPLVFPDNDRPGIMSAEAALVYLRRHGVLVGERIVVATNNDGAHTVALELQRAGANVMVADLRSPAVSVPGVETMSGTTVDAVHGARGVEAVTISGRRIEADCLLVSGGFTPTVHLFCQNKGRLRFDDEIAAFVPDTGPDGLVVAGAANGRFALSRVLADGHAAGGGGDGAPGATSPDASYRIESAWPRKAAKARQWVDFQNDVTVKDVELAARENFVSVEHLKRYTTLGMATDQGKTSNMNGLAAMAAITGRSIADTGTTTYRPPFVPVPFGVVSGRRRAELFNPVRRLALEPEHRAAGAVFREYGGWLRPAWYGSGHAFAETQREARLARQTVAIFDGSPLGKIEVMGPAAAELTDYNSYNTLSNLKPGRLRYGFMLTESGMVYDDGVTSRIADDHFVVSCSSGHVAGVVSRLEEWRQDRFDPATVAIHNSTVGFVTLTATGPLSRKLVEALSLGIDLDDAALPHMAFAPGAFAGGPVRVARVSFTGDRSYEITVPAANGSALFAAMVEAGRPLDAFPMGSEALLLLRAEKGFLIAGKDTDGNTMPHDLGITGPRDKRVNEYVGRRSLFTENAMRTDRRHFVGFRIDGPDPLPTGAHAVESNGSALRSIGFVTSSHFSPTLGRPIALGLVERGMERSGESVGIYHLGRTMTATIAPPCALDPEGTRLHA